MSMRQEFRTPTPSGWNCAWVIPRACRAPLGSSLSLALQRGPNDDGVHAFARDVRFGQRRREGRLEPSDGVLELMARRLERSSVADDGLDSTAIGVFVGPWFEVGEAAPHRHERCVVGKSEKSHATSQPRLRVVASVQATSRSRNRRRQNGLNCLTPWS